MAKSTVPQTSRRAAKAGTGYIYTLIVLIVVVVFVVCAAVVLPSYVAQSTSRSSAAPRSPLDPRVFNIARRASYGPPTTNAPALTVAQARDLPPDQLPPGNHDDTSAPVAEKRPLKDAPVVINPWSQTTMQMPDKRPRTSPSPASTSPASPSPASPSPPAPSPPSPSPASPAAQTIEVPAAPTQERSSDPEAESELAAPRSGSEPIVPHVTHAGPAPATLVDPIAAVQTSDVMEVDIVKSPADWRDYFVGNKVAGAAELQFKSKEVVKPWSGDFMEPGAMDALLAARAYKKEIILTTADGGHLEDMLNLLMDFRDLGMEHTAVFMDTEASCSKATAVWPNMGCAWSKFLSDDHPTPYWTRIIHMWLMRWLLFNSIVRRGYNPFILDTDNSVRMDPYFFLKSEMFREYSLVVAYDDAIPEINCGAIYGQNVAPDGPVAWITAEVVDRLLRWTENWSWFQQRLNVTTDLEGDTFFRVTFEQYVFGDAACSCMRQRPRFYHSLSPRNKDIWPFPWWDTDWRDRHSVECRWWNKTDAVALPDAWQLFARAKEQRVKYVDLRLPYSHGEYPREWGHDPFPPERGHFSNTFQEWLRRDVPAMWPDVDDASDPDGKRKRVEKMAQAPMWLLSRWIEIGERLGTWNLNPPMGVVNHLLVPGGRDNVLKSGIMRIYGWWHFEASTLLRGKAFAKSAVKVGPEPTDTQVPKLVAFAPSVELLFKRRDSVHPAFLQSLVKAALLSERVPVFPLVPCDSPWLAHRSIQGRHTQEATNVADRFVVQFGPRTDLRCFWKAWSCTRCEKVGMAWYDFERTLQDLADDDRFPHEGNTLFFDRLQMKRRAVNGMLAWPEQAEAERPPVDAEPHDVSYDFLIQQLEATKDRQVLWVGAWFNASGTIDSAADIDDRIQKFDQEIQLCPEC